MAVVEKVASRLTWMGILLFGRTLMASAAEPAAPEQPESPAASRFEDLAEPFVPARPRSSLEEDQLQARALFAAARTLEQQEKYGRALRLYERALRLDPDSMTILRQVVQAGILHYDRVTEVLPYALRLVERDPAFAPQLKLLSQGLIDSGDLPGALKLLQTSLAAEPLDKHTARYILLQNEIGRLLFLTGDTNAAADALTEVAAALDKPDEYNLSRDVVKALLDPPSKTWALFGEVFLLANRPQPAIEAFQKAYHDGKKQQLLNYQLARAHLAQGEAEQALGELTSYLESDESVEGAGPYELLGQILEKLDRQADYIPRLEELHKARPDDANLGLLLADRYRQAGQAEQAIALYENLLRDAPDSPAAARLVDMYREAKDDAKLLQVLGKFVGHSGDLASLGEQAEALAKDKELLQRLLAQSAQLRSDKPDEFDYGPRLATALLALAADDYAVAGEHYRLAIESMPAKAAELYLGWGVGLLLDEKSAEAAEVFQQAIDSKALPDDNPVFHYYLSGALAMADRTAEALSAIDSAIKTSPESPRLHSRLAWIHYRAKQYSEAARAYEDLIDKFAEAGGSSQEVRRLVREARLALSNLCVLQKNLPAAEEWLERILDEDPDNISALNDLGYLWADQGKHLERALRMAQQAVAAEPENQAYLDTLGWVLFRLGRFEEALPHLLKAAKDEKQTDGVVLDHLGDAHNALQQTDAAITAWRKALERYDPQDDAERIEATKAKLMQAGAQ